MNKNNMVGIQFYTVILILIPMIKSSANIFEVHLNGTSKRSGIVEQRESMKWKPLCGKACWSDTNANVTCKELGFGGGIMPSGRTKITDPTRTRYNCNGTEVTLNDCPHISQCGSNDSCTIGAEVICQGAVRLNDYNSSNNIRRVEIFLKNLTNNYEWRGLCGGDCWSRNNTNVVCKQFGFRFGELQAGQIETASSSVWEQKKYACVGNETDLSDCPATRTCKPCNTTSVVVRCSSEGIGYNKTCVHPQSCNDSLVCENKVCTCDDKSRLFWNKDKQKCTERIGYNNTCKNPHRCKDSLICRNEVCTCGNESRLFWNEIEQKCTEKLTFNDTCTDKASCIDGLVCKNVGDHLCRCNDEANSFWNSDENTCKERSSFETKCASSMHNSCNDTLVCTDEVSGPVCRCKKGNVWNRKTETCIKMSLINESCESDDHCIRNLVCKGTGFRYCTCGTDVEFWNTRTSECQQRSSFSAVFVSTVQTFESARGFCTTNHSGYLASSDEVRHLFPECVTIDTNMWLEKLSEQDKENEITQEQLCPFGIESNGALYVNQTNCSETYSFLCVSNEISSTNSANSSSCHPSSRQEQVDKDILLPAADPLLWPIYVGASIAVLVIILIVAGLCYKRRRKTKSKCGQGVYCDKRNVDLNYSEAVLNNEYSLPDVNVKGNQATNQLTNGEEEGMYSLAQSDFSGPRSGSTTQTTATDHYGYSVLGGKRAENDDNGMYSHARRMNDTGEYDTFDKRDRDTDVNVLYDHTRGVMMENQYDEFQKRK